MKPPRAFIIIVVFVCLIAACGGHSTVNISPPQGSGTPSGSSGPANPPIAQASPSITPPGTGCDENYDPCVPIASDVDCAGGPGNGPEYVQGPVKIVGKDIYELDRDKNGLGCEKRN